MMINFSESGHLVFRGSSAFERGELKGKGKGKFTIHFNGSDETVKVILRAVSVNQPSVYGAVAKMCEELAWEISKCSKVDNLETMAIHQKCPQQIEFLRPMQEYRETCCVNTTRSSQTFQNTSQLTELCSNAGLAKTVEKRTVLHDT